LIYTRHGKNLTNTPYTRRPVSHVQQPFAKSLLSQNWAPAPRMKSWNPVMPGLAVILGCLILPPTNHLEAGGQVRKVVTRLLGLPGPRKTRHVASRNQSLQSGQNDAVLNRHRWGLPHKKLGIATTLSPSFPSECSKNPTNCSAQSSNNNKYSLYSSYP
jgi:hypothetical protein